MTPRTSPRTTLGPTARPTRRHRRALAALAVAVVGLAACGDDDAASPDVTTPDVTAPDATTPDDVDGERDEFGVALLDAGDGDDRVALPPAYEVGHSGTTELEMTISLSVDAGTGSTEVAVAMLMEMFQEVVDVTDDIATVEARIDSIEMLDATDVGNQALAQYDGIIGETVVGRYSSTGVQVGPMELADGSPLPAEFADLFQSSDTMAFPSQPVAVGARWSSLDEIDVEGLTIAGETIYELRELTDDRYVLELSQNIPLDERIDGADMRGEYVASGTISGSRDNPLLVDMVYEQDGGFTMSAGTERAEMATRIVIDMVTR